MNVNYETAGFGARPDVKVGVLAGCLVARRCRGVKKLPRDAPPPSHPTPQTLRDVSAAEFIATYAAHVKKGGKIQLPEWVDVVKTARESSAGGRRAGGVRRAAGSAERFARA